jgi:hypothetical protein
MRRTQGALCARRLTPPSGRAAQEPPGGPICVEELHLDVDTARSMWALEDAELSRAST